MLTKEEQGLFYIRLGARVKSIRRKSKIKQETLAKALGFSRISIVNVEQGTQKIQIHTLIELSNILNVSLTELLPSLPVNSETSAISNKIISKVNQEVSQSSQSNEKALEFLKQVYLTSKEK